MAAGRTFWVGIERTCDIVDVSNNERRSLVVGTMVMILSLSRRYALSKGGVGCRGEAFSWCNRNNWIPEPRAFVTTVPLDNVEIDVSVAGKSKLVRNPVEISTVSSPGPSPPHTSCSAVWEKATKDSRLPSVCKVEEVPAVTSRVIKEFPPWELGHMMTNRSKTCE